jgi:hypothetical protein
VICCRIEVSRRFPALTRTSVHILTDLDVGPAELEQLLAWAKESTFIRIYTWKSPQVATLVTDYPDLERLIEYLPT